MHKFINLFYQGKEADCVIRCVCNERDRGPRSIKVKYIKVNPPSSVILKVPRSSMKPPSTREIIITNDHVVINILYLSNYNITERSSEVSKRSCAGTMRYLASLPRSFASQPRNLASLPRSFAS